VHQFGQLIFLAFLLISSSQAEDLPATPCGDLGESMSKKVIECMIGELIHSSYPELKSAYSSGRIQINEFNSRHYFLKTSISKGKFSKKGSRRTYSVDVNPKFYFSYAMSGADVPTYSSVQGILAHELEHLVDYELSTRQGLIEIGLKALFNPSEYERSTDIRAFKRGFAPGIQNYRRWIYGQLSARALQKKKQRYFTPEEIDEWIYANP